MPSIIDARCCQRLQNSCDALTINIGETKSKNVSDILDAFHEIAKRRLIQGLGNCEDLLTVSVPVSVFNLCSAERDEVEDILKTKGGWVPTCGDRGLIIFSPEAGIKDPMNCQLTYLHKTGRFCKICSAFTEYRDADERWVCPSCDRWVGCYPDADIAMGSVATSAERRARVRLHEIVDALWKTDYLPRKEVYLELSQVLNIPRPYTHIAMIEVDRFPIIEAWAKARLEQLKKEKETRYDSCIPLK